MFFPHDSLSFSPNIWVAERVGAFPHGVRGVILPLRVAMAGEEKKWAVMMRNKLVMRT